MTTPPFDSHIVNPTTLDTIANVMLLVGGIGTAIFAVGYFVLFRWYETAAGRQLLGFAASLVLVLVLSIVSWLGDGDYPGRDELRLAASTLVAIAAWGFVVMLARAWIRNGPERPGDIVRRTPTEETRIMADTEHGKYHPVDERVLNTVELAHTEDGGTLVASNLGVPTQVANPFRATLRTVAAVAVGLVLALPVVNAVLAIVADELARSGAELPAWLWATVNGAIGVVAVVSGIVTRVLAIPGVNDWLASHAVTRGLTAVPLQKV